MASRGELRRCGGAPRGAHIPLHVVCPPTPRGLYAPSMSSGERARNGGHER
jgi:hypothetical protein